MEQSKELNWDQEMGASSRNEELLPSALQDYLDLEVLQEGLVSVVFSL